MAEPDNSREFTTQQDGKNDRIIPERPVPANRVETKTFDHIPELNYRPGQRN